MAPGSAAARSKRGAAAGGVDRLSALEDKLLQRVLSFLPSSEAVQTCVLARRWRHQWKSVPALRVTNADDYRYANDLNMFVNSMLLFRNRDPLHVVEINSYHGEDSDEAYRYLELWIRYGLSHKARTLRVRNNVGIDRWKLPKGLITSNHLTVLELFDVNLKGDRSKSLDFSSCPALEDLRMKSCDIEASMIMSRSVKRLRLKSCHFNWVARPQMSAPNVIFLELVDCEGRTPLFERMPLLVSAFVRLMTGIDCCDKNHETGDCNSCMGCCGSNIGNNTSVLLESLSAATNLELISADTEFIFRKDLTQWPVFSKLKTLLLNEWCMTANLGALKYLLQHSPVLEKLTLQLPETHVDLVDNGATYGTAKEPVALKHLTVEMKCHKDAKGFPRVLELLDSYGVPSEQIKIQQPPQLIEFKDDDDKPWPSASWYL